MSLILLFCFNFPVNDASTCSITLELSTAQWRFVKKFVMRIRFFGGMFMAVRKLASTFAKSAACPYWPACIEVLSPSVRFFSHEIPIAQCRGAYVPHNQLIMECSRIDSPNLLRLSAIVSIPNISKALLISKIVFRSIVWSIDGK